MPNIQQEQEQEEVKLEAECDDDELPPLQDKIIVQAEEQNEKLRSAIPSVASVTTTQESSSSE